jgi:hypothetical protein
MFDGLFFSVEFGIPSSVNGYDIKAFEAMTKK